MAGYLEDYGVAEERRERIIKLIIVSAVVVAVIGVALYYTFRDYREERRIKSFLELLDKRDYQAAYRLWGCTETEPCREYLFEKFLEDWGPESAFSDLSAVRVAETRSCKDGIIQILEIGKDEEIWLWVARSDRIISYAPWPVCTPPLVPPSSIDGL